MEKKVVGVQIIYQSLLLILSDSQRESALQVPHRRPITAVVIFRKGANNNESAASADPSQPKHSITKYALCQYQEAVRHLHPLN
jgi:hypothetical protein